MFTCTLQNHTSSVASEDRCLEPPYSAWGVLLEVFLLEKQHVVHLVAVTTPYLRARVRRSSIVELVVIGLINAHCRDSVFTEGIRHVDEGLVHAILVCYV